MSEGLILFICTGNLCRSPMAEYMLRHRLGSNSEWKICSGGLSAASGMPASPPTVEILKEYSIDLSPHRSRPVTRELVDAASLIVVMTASHREQMLELFPDAFEKVFLMKFFDSASGDGDVDDPIGLPIDIYYKIRDEIEAALPGLIEFIRSLE